MIGADPEEYVRRKVIVLADLTEVMRGNSSRRRKTLIQKTRERKREIEEEEEEEEKEGRQWGEKVLL